MKKKSWVTIIKLAYGHCSKDQIPRLGAALAYYSIFSLTPLIFFCITLVGWIIGKKEAQAKIISQLNIIFGEKGASQIQVMLEHLSGSFASNHYAMIISIICLLCGMTGIFTELQSGFRIIWGIKISPHQGWSTLIKSQFLSFVMVCILAFLFLTSLIISSMITIVGNYFNHSTLIEMWWFLNLFISIGLITLFFALIFKILPENSMDWVNIWIGAFVSSILFTIGKFAFDIYIAKFNFYEYGPASALIILLLWIYYSAQILYFGAELTKVVSTLPDKVDK